MGSGINENGVGTMALRIKHDEILNLLLLGIYTGKALVKPTLSTNRILHEWERKEWAP